MGAELLVGRFRQFLLWLTILVCVGVIAELLLTGHDEEPLQFVPFVLCGLAILAAGAALIRPTRMIINALRGLMIVVALGGALGSFEHLEGNLELAREVNATKANANVLKTAFTGANPALAPGALGVVALIAIAATYQQKHER